MRVKKSDNISDRWPPIAWMSMVTLVAVAFVLGFLVLGRYRLYAPTVNVWVAMCRSLGLTPDLGAANEPQPTPQTPTSISWTTGTLAQISSGDKIHGAFIALNCTACHGEAGISSSDLAPTLAGIDAAATFKELADYRSGKRLWGVMNGISAALSAQDSADVAAYYASLPGGLPVLTGRSTPASGRTLRETDSAARLVFAGDPARGIAPCASCHGPEGYKLGAPALTSQRARYIERQTAAFAQGLRGNDINMQMRTIAKELAPDEMRAIAVLYGGGAPQ